MDGNGLKTGPLQAMDARSQPPAHGARVPAILRDSGVLPGEQGCAGTPFPGPGSPPSSFGNCRFPAKPLPEM